MLIVPLLVFAISCNGQPMEYGGGGPMPRVQKPRQPIREIKYNLVHSSKKPSAPKIIHFIWWQGIEDLVARAESGKTAEHNSPDWRAQFIPRWIESWKIQHPTSRGWEHKMWDESSLINLAKELNYLDLMNKLPERIKKIDLSRYLILLKHGGIVTDVDFESFKPIDSLIQGHSAVLAEENADQSINCAWIASIPQHPIWTNVLNEISKRQLKEPNRGVMYITGPRMLTYVSEEWERARWEMTSDQDDGYDIYILRHASRDNRLLYPYHADHMGDKNNREIMSSSCSEENNCAKKYPNSYAMHHFAATWYDHYKIEINL